jgi:hypothetical protein
MFIYKFYVYIFIWCAEYLNLLTAVLYVILQLLQLNVESLMKLVLHISVRNVSGNNTQVPKNVVLFFVNFQLHCPHLCMNGCHFSVNLLTL